MKKMIAILAIFAIFALLVLAGCTKKEAAAPSAKTADVAEPADAKEAETVAAEATTQEPAAAQIREFTLTAKRWEFEPATIEVNKGDRVVLTITSEDVKHGFAIDDFGVAVTLEPGKTVTTEFVADKAGTFDFYCSVFCGEGHGGMRGTLIVKE